MAGILQYSWETYTSHLQLITLFSIAFLIASLIPVFVYFPTFNDAGAIFIRTSSVLASPGAFTVAIILFSSILSLLFLSFAIVAINVIVKHSRTRTRITSEVREGLEKHTAAVFAALLLYMAAITVAGFIGVYYSATYLTSLVGLALAPFFLYAPASIVIDGTRVWRALGASYSFFFKRLDMTAVWLAAALVLLTAFDFLFIMGLGTVASRYAMLIFNSVFVLPFLVVLQSQAYMRRFGILGR